MYYFTYNFQRELFWTRGSEYGIRCDNCYLNLVGLQVASEGTHTQVPSTTPRGEMSHGVNVEFVAVMAASQAEGRDVIRVVARRSTILKC